MIKRAQAFTLVEMLLVITIMAVLSGALVVSLKGRQDEMALRAAAQDLSEAVRYAALQARTFNRPCRVVFTPNLSEYKVEIFQVREMRFIPAAGRAGLPKRLTPGIDIAEIAPALPVANDVIAGMVFGSNGAGYSGRVSLKNRAGRMTHIEVAAETGQVHLRQ